MSKGVHLHVHCEESVLDGLSTVVELVKKAKSLNQSALALTDHGVCSAIPNFIEACIHEGIRPIPGCEVYTTKDRFVQSDALEAMRLDLCLNYGLVDNKGKPKKKALQTFLRTVDKNPLLMREEATILLKDALMGSTKETYEQLDLLAEAVENRMASLANDPDMLLSMFEKEVRNYLDHRNFHLVLLAKNNQGLEDLYAIVSDAHINGFYKDPRTDLAYIREKGLGKNIIATSACLGGQLSKLCLAGRIEEAKDFIQEAKETFGDFYLEKQATHIPEQITLNRIIDQLAIETNTKKILTTDVHYANKEDREIHDLIVASSTGKCISDEDRMIYAHEFWMKSDEEMMEGCNDEEAWANTLAIANEIHVTLPTSPLFPKFMTEEEDTTEVILRKHAWSGLFEILLNNPALDVGLYSRRLQYELDVICSEGFQDYFLIEEDMIKATVDAGYLVGPGRGSGAGSLVCFALRITWLDPIKENLLFERFLNPERVGYPDCI